MSSLQWFKPQRGSSVPWFPACTSNPLDLAFALCRTYLAVEETRFILRSFHVDSPFLQNVANLEQTAAELFASLADSRAHFGQGVYGTQREPSAVCLDWPRVGYMEGGFL